MNRVDTFFVEQGFCDFSDFVTEPFDLGKIGLIVGVNSELSFFERQIGCEAVEMAELPGVADSVLLQGGPPRGDARAIA